MITPVCSPGPWIPSPVIFHFRAIRPRRWSICHLSRFSDRRARDEFLRERSRRTEGCATGDSATPVETALAGLARGKKAHREETKQQIHQILRGGNRSRARSGQDIQNGAIAETTNMIMRNPGWRPGLCSVSLTSKPNRPPPGCSQALAHDARAKGPILIARRACR